MEKISKVRFGLMFLLGIGIMAAAIGGVFVTTMGFFGLSSAIVIFFIMAFA